MGGPIDLAKRDRNNVYELGCELYWKTIS